MGAGIVGSSIAWRLAQAGVRVGLADAGALGGEASSAGAGMLAPSGEFEGQAALADLARESQRLYPGYVRDLESESGVKIDFAICGSLDLSPGAMERARRQAQAGMRSEITPDGVLYPDDGFVDPTDVLTALRRALERYQVDLREHCRISRLDTSEAQAIVLSAGAWSSEVVLIHNGRPLPLEKAVPVKGHLLGYQLTPGSLPRILRRGHTYLLQRSSGFTIAGSNEEHVGFDRHVDEDRCRELEQRAGELWPQLVHEAPVRRWVGFRPATGNMELQMGRIHDTNVWLSYGHFRNGILLAPLTAHRIAGEIISSLGRG